MNYNLIFHLTFPPFNPSLFTIWFGVSVIIGTLPIFINTIMKFMLNKKILWYEWYKLIEPYDVHTFSLVLSAATLGTLYLKPIDGSVVFSISIGSFSLNSSTIWSYNTFVQIHIIVLNIVFLALHAAAKNRRLIKNISTEILMVKSSMWLASLSIFFSIYIVLIYGI